MTTFEACVDAEEGREISVAETDGRGRGEVALDS